jgi:hypothetical protein
MASTVSKHVQSDLPELVLGTLDPAARAEVERHLMGCAECQAEAQQLTRTLHRAAGALPSEPAPGALWSALAPQVEGPGRFGVFAAEVAELFDLTPEAAATLLTTLDGSAEWGEGPAEGVQLLPVQAGPRCGDAITSFARIPAGVWMPAHDHVGRERMLVIQGGFREEPPAGSREPGAEFWRGDFCDRDLGTSHRFIGLPGLDCIAAVVLHVDDEHGH